MKKLYWTALTMAVMVGAAAVTRAADENAGTGEQQVTVVSVADPGYAGYFDDSAFQDAVTALDAAALADIALKLAEGERVLLRSHSSGATSQAVLQFAVKVATDKKDAATLERLSAAAERGQMGDLKAQIEAAKQLAQASRAATGTKVAIGDVDANTLMVYELLSDKIQFARSIGDRAVLEDIRDTVAEYVDLTDELQSAIKAAATDALANLPEQTDEATQALAVLAGGARVTGSGTLAIAASGNSPGGSITIERIPSKPPMPVVKCTFANPSTKETVSFTCHGTGKAYDILPGKTMSFTIYGKYVPPKTTPPPVVAGVGVIALDLGGAANQTEGKIVPPVLLFWKTGPFKIKIPAYFRVPTNGSFNFVKGSNGQWYLKRR